MLSLGTLGPVRLTGAGGELLPGRRKELVLLTYLARRSPRPVSRAELATLLWGERPEANARQSLRQALLNLKRVVDGLEIETETVTLPDGALEFDVLAFERDLASGRLAEGVERWQGDFLTDADDAGGDAYRAWLESERQALRARLAWALEQLVEQTGRRGETEAAIRWAARWTEALPLEERPQTCLIEALRRAGREGDALARHAAFVTRVRQELEAEPSPQFLRLGSPGAREAPRPRSTPGSTALFTPDFVGRTAALAELAAAWRAARAGAAALVLIEGEAGMGKTRLCEEFLRSLGDQDDHLVLRARARPEDADDTVSVLRQLGTGLAQAPGVSGAPAGALRALAQHAPALRERFPQLPEAPGSSWATDEALAQVLAAVAGEQPVVVFLDDVDSGTARQIIPSLGERLRDAAMLILATGDPARLAPLHAVYGARPIRLHPLARLDIESLVGSMLTLQPDDLRLLAGRLESETGGQPLYLVETLRALLDEGHLVPDAGGVWRPAQPLEGRPLPLPTSVREAFARRLALLSDEARRLIEAAATLPTPAEGEHLRTASRLSHAEFQAALEELLVRRLLRESSSPTGAYLFSHELGRRAAYEAIPLSRRGAASGAWARSSAALKAWAGQGDPVRVAALFGAGSAVVLAVVFILLMQLGLPDWVLTAALALLAIGLPIMVVTGLEERRRALGRSAGDPAQPGLARYFTWRNALLGGGLAFGGLAAGTAAFMALRALGVKPFATLLTAGVLRERDALVLADFANRTPDTTLALSITEAIRIDLTRSPVVRLVDPNDVAATLRRMQREPTRGLSEATALEVGQRAGAKAVVAGDVAPLGSGYVLTARLVNAGDGSTLVAERETAADAAAIIPAVERLSQQLRKRIGESLRTIRSGRPLEQVTTSSLAALRAYSEGRSAMNDGREDDALRFLNQAIALDSTFGMAWRSVGVILFNLGTDRSLLLKAIRRAYQLRDRMSPVEAAHTTAVYYRFVEGNRSQTIATYENLLATWPDDAIALNNLGVWYGVEGRLGDAERAWSRAVELKPNNSVYLGNLVESQAWQGKFAAADSSLNAWAVWTPGHPYRLRHAARLAREQGRFDVALLSLDSAMSAEAPEARIFSYGVRAETLRLLGRFREAERQSAQIMDLLGRGGRYSAYLVEALNVAIAEAFVLRHAEAAVRRVAAALARHPLESLPPASRPYGQLVGLYLVTGQLPRAQSLFADYERAVPLDERSGDGWWYDAKGQLALARRDPATALEAFRAAKDRFVCRLCTSFDEAQAFEQLAEPDSAILRYEDFAAPSLSIEKRDVFLAAALRRLGELYQQRGEPERAAEYYHRFIELWKNADPELQAAVRDARQQLVALAADRPTPALRGPPAANSVAVLGFRNVSGDTADAFLVEGLAEGLITRLGHLQRVEVKSRSATKRYPATADPSAIGQALGVAHMVAGTVRRRDRRLRITVELVATANGAHEWGDQYDRPDADLLAIEQDISRQVASAITGRLLPAEQATLAAQSPRDPRAYEQFLRGNYDLAQLTGNSVARAIAEYEAAVRIDPTFTQALGRIAYGYAVVLDWGWNFLGLPRDSLLARGFAYADRTLRQDSSVSEGWMARAFLLLNQNPRTLDGASDAVQRAIALNRRNAEAVHRYGYILSLLGEDSAAAEVYQRALALDPARAGTLASFAILAFNQRRYPRALRLLDSALTIDPAFYYLYVVRSVFRRSAGNIRGARADAETAVRLGAADQVAAQAALAAVEAREGQVAAARSRVERSLEGLPRTGPIFLVREARHVAAALVEVNEPEPALDLLERIRPRGGLLWQYLEWPDFDRVRSHPRFQRLLAEVTPRRRS
ncbi:MAG: AAA family ATPase [Gemmatimonadetes bacterium]|nr:AAA family ATPase [Gemmatimonadota bacterium]